MPQTQIACPRCKQMITANVEQLFDVTSDREPSNGCSAEFEHGTLSLLWL